MGAGTGIRVLMTVEGGAGVWTYAAELIGALSARGFEFVAACGGATPANVERLRRAGCVRVEAREQPLEWTPEGWRESYAAGAWLVDLAHECGAGLVHLNGMGHGALPFRVPTVVVGHSCILSWWEAVCEGRAPCQWDEYRRRGRETLRAADAMVAPTEWMLGRLRRLWEAPALSRVIPHGRTPAVPARRKEPVVFAAAGVWDEAKNIGLLAQVAAELPWLCVAAGEDVRPAGRWCGLGALKPLGRLDERQMWERLASASIFVHPARYEPFGLAPLEAAMSGCALVLGDVPSLREVWGGAAEYVSPDDAEGLKRVLLGLIADEPRRRSLASRASECASRYTAARLGAAYASLYREVLSGHAAASTDRVRAGAA